MQWESQFLPVDIQAIPRIADEDIARNLVRKGWWDPLLEKQPGDDGRILRLWRQLEEEAMASEQRGQVVFNNKNAYFFSDCIRVILC
jgi:hypothetical protein